ncbi:hypothetical protein KIN20_002702 [Parelaphostrongylus tenuis]|uniref:Uncharacterized protein n=1 Tax=Parelaphostrongylus tenuis TaxID=148309 RepID=A0AAD5QFJ7_PARTN|nr:hypothetical protein KIN20_002702 [Parelaphostrongylus tenuis]
MGTKFRGIMRYIHCSHFDDDGAFSKIGDKFLHHTQETREENQTFFDEICSVAEVQLLVNK